MGLTLMFSVILKAFLNIKELKTCNGSWKKDKSINYLFRMSPFSLYVSIICIILFITCIFYHNIKSVFIVCNMYCEALGCVNIEMKTKSGYNLNYTYNNDRTRPKR